MPARLTHITLRRTPLSWGFLSRGLQGIYWLVAGRTENT